MNLFSSRTTGKDAFTGLRLALTLLCSVVWTFSSCSKEDLSPPSTGETAQANGKKKTGPDGIEIIEHPALPESKEPLRPLATAPAPEAAQPLTVNGEGGVSLTRQPRRPATLPAAEPAAEQKLQKAESPQTAPMRLEARHQAMAEMLRVRKAVEGNAPVGGK